MAAVVIGSLGLDVGPRKFVAFRVDRTDLPHLTLSWNNPSGEVDVHLTPASPKDKIGPKSIVKIQESELKTRFGELAKQLWDLTRNNPVQMVWGVQARWLAKQGFVLVGPRDEPVIAWLQRALPKRRGKYRVDEARFKQLPRLARHFPTARRLEELGQDGLIYAMCHKGVHRGRVLLLGRLSFGPAPPTWLALDSADMGRLGNALSRLLRKWLTGLAPGAWQRIREGLQLREVGL